MELLIARAGSDQGLVATDNVVTVGCWFYFGYFWVSPAVLAERELRTT